MAGPTLCLLNGLTITKPWFGVNMDIVQINDKNVLHNPPGGGVFVGGVLL